MGNETKFSSDGSERVPLHQFTEKAYLEYSMYVILDRALPHIGDGLKPVQRRIIYAMSELGLRSEAKYKKSARTVGDVLGKFHPHGDSACYEAMVHMAQPFMSRYPLVDGQGNWGSTDDPKSFAAMRYTEAKLAPIAKVLLDELDQGTVDWVANFDGTLDEPALLPSRLPMVLLNGASGIAVGMATDIPPHNLKEVASAVIHLIDNPEATIPELCKHIKGPDFPTKAEIITPRAEINAIYKTGQGSIRMRAVYEVDDGDIIITALPYQTSGSKVLEQIAQQMAQKKLPMIEDLRDESDHENPTRLIIVPKVRKANTDELMAHLFATTDLEKTYRVNMNMIGLDGRPGVRDLHELLSEWLEFRTRTVQRRLQNRLEKVLNRLHILDGLLIAFLNIDEVIKIIRREDEPKPVLMKRFKLTEIQAEAILELKLRHLAKLEEMKIKGEQKELAKERDVLEATLASKKKLNNLIKKEIEEDVETYGDKRRSPIVAREEAQALDLSALIPVEPLTIVVSQKGFVRAAKGHEFDIRSLTYKAGDGFLAASMGRTNQNVVFMDTTGRCYSLPGHSLPSARGYGDSLHQRLKLASGVQFRGTAAADDEQLVFVGSDAGYGFIAKYGDLVTKNKSGKSIVNVPEGARALPIRNVAEHQKQYLALVTNTNLLLLIALKELPLLDKGKGLKLIDIPAAKALNRTEFVQDAVVIGLDQKLAVHAANKHTLLSGDDLEKYVGERATRGTKLPRSLQGVERLDVVI